MLLAVVEVVSVVVESTWVIYLEIYLVGVVFVHQGRDVVMIFR